MICKKTNFYDQFQVLDESQ